MKHNTRKKFERSYTTTRIIFSIVEFAGWFAIIAGVILAIIGFSSAGMLDGLFTQNTGRSPIIVNLLATLPGFGIALAGLMSIAYAQSCRAHVDTAEMTRELLTLARNQTSSENDAEILHIKDPILREPRLGEPVIDIKQIHNS